MLMIDHEKIMSLNIKLLDIFNWVSESILNKNNALLPAKTSLKLNKNGFFNIMPSILKEENVYGVKTVTRYPNRTPTLDSQILLYEYSSGNLLALLDASFITTTRTAAVAVHSIYNFAVDDSKSIAFIGLGIQARATMKIIAEVFPSKKFKIKLFKYKEQHITFSQLIKSLPNSELYVIEYVDNYEDCIKDTDIIISAATYFENDICDEIYFKDGCLLVPIHTRGFLNCDLAFDKIFVDDIKHVEGFKNFNIFKNKATEVADVVNARAKGRTLCSERIIAYNIGIASHDIYIANKIHQLIKNSLEEKNIIFSSPNTKLWF